MEKFVHLPFYKKLVQNCFVRIGIGNNPQGRPVYRAAEIVEVVETGKVYYLGKVRTNIGLKLRFGKQDRVFRLEFISNQRITPQEFNKWKETCEESNVALPTIEFVKSKTHEIKKAINYNYTSDDIDKIVASKEKFQRHPTNYAMHKARLIKEKEIAVANGEDERARELEAKINELEERAEELDKKRTATISSVSFINERNRKANVSKAEAAIMREIRQKRDEGAQDNPFARKKCNPRIVTKSQVNVAKATVPPPVVPPPPVIPLPVVLPVVAQKENKRKNDEDNNDTEKTKKKPKFGNLALSSQKEDLFDAHDFDIDINVDTSLTPSAGNPGGGAAAVVTPINIKPASKDGAPAKRSLNLDDYKRKRGLI
jgi:RNA polymerase-associated protein RTF1